MRNRRLKNFVPRNLPVEVSVNVDEAGSHEKTGGVDFLYANPKEAAAILAKTYNLPPDVAANALNNTLKQNPTWWSRGELQQPVLDVSADALIAVGALQPPVDWKTAIQPGFQPPAHTQ